MSTKTAPDSPVINPHPILAKLREAMIKKFGSVSAFQRHVGGKTLSQLFNVLNGRYPLTDQCFQLIVSGLELPDTERQDVQYLFTEYTTATFGLDEFGVWLYERIVGKFGTVHNFANNLGLTRARVGKLLSSRFSNATLARLCSKLELTPDEVEQARLLYFRVRGLPIKRGPKTGTILVKGPRSNFVADETTIPSIIFQTLAEYPDSAVTIGDISRLSEGYSRMDPKPTRKELRTIVRFLLAKKRSEPAQVS